MTSSPDAEVVKLLKEICSWLRIGFRSQAKDALGAILNTDKKRRAYQMTDGENTRDTIRKACAMSPNTLLQLWNDCIEAGLMEVLPDGRRRRQFDLAKFGLLEEQETEG